MSNKPHYREQDVYRVDMSSLCRFTEKFEFDYKHKEILVAAVLDIEEAFDKPSIGSIIQAPRWERFDETRCRLLDAYLKVVGDILVVQGVSGCLTERSLVAFVMESWKLTTYYVLKTKIGTKCLAVLTSS